MLLHLDIARLVLGEFCVLLEGKCSPTSLLLIWPNCWVCVEDWFIRLNFAIVQINTSAFFKSFRNAFRDRWPLPIWVWQAKMLVNLLKVFSFSGYLAQENCVQSFQYFLSENRHLASIRPLFTEGQWLVGKSLSCEWESRDLWPS